MVGPTESPSLVGRVLVAGGLASLVLLLNFVYGVAGCGTENNGCALGPARLWQGRAFAPTAVPLARATVRYVFSSNSADKAGLSRPFTIVTDSAGRYCLDWPDESQVAFVSAVGGAPRGAPDPRYVTTASAAGGPLIVSPDDGRAIAQDSPAPGQMTNAGWNPSVDATGVCVRGSPPWYRIEALTSNWRYRLLIWLPLASLALLACAVLVRSARRTLAVMLARGALAAAVLSACLFVPIWLTHSL